MLCSMLRVSRLCQRTASLNQSTELGTVIKGQAAFDRIMGGIEEKKKKRKASKLMRLITSGSLSTFLFVI